MVIKNSTLIRTSSGQHTVRHQGGNRLLVQGSSLTAPGQHTSLTVRGNTAWVFVQGNFFNQPSGTNPQYDGADELQHYVVWERNVLDATNAGTQWGLLFIGQDMIIRNNVSYNNSGFHFRASSQSPISAQNIWFINNTVFTNKSANDGIVCGGTGCVMKNNLVYSTKSFANGCFSGGTQSEKLVPVRQWLP